jgi:hypothetical protein
LELIVSRKIRVLVLGGFAMALLCGVPALFAQDSQAPQPGTAQVTITAQGKHGAAPALTAQDVSVREDKSLRQVISLVPLDRAGVTLQLMILIDSDATTRLAAQFRDVSAFINSLPQNAQVGLAYALNGSARIDQPPTTDRAAITKALHVTFGPAIGNTSVYSALDDLIRKWPGAPTGREVLLVSDGIDPTYGLFDTQPDQNPGLLKAIRDAQQTGVTIFSIFAGSGRMTRNQILNLNGQGSLSELTSDTGGYSFTQGTHTPVSFQPFLNDLQKMLSGQYVLTFNVQPAKSAGYHDLKVTTETSGVKILAPRRVYISASE